MIMIFDSVIEHEGVHELSNREELHTKCSVIGWRRVEIYLFIYLFRIQTLSLKKVQTILIVTESLRCVVLSLSLCVSGVSLKLMEAVSQLLIKIELILS